MDEGKRFVMALENLYGSYRQSMMRELVLAWATKPPFPLGMIFELITNEHTFARPPMKAEIVKLVRANWSDLEAEVTRRKPRNPRRIEDGYGDVVSREEGAARLKEIREKLEKREVQPVEDIVEGLVSEKTVDPVVNGERAKRMEDRKTELDAQAQTLASA